MFVYFTLTLLFPPIDIILAIAKNPYIAWMFVYHDTFEQAMEQIDDLETNDQYNALILPGSIEEACLAFKCNC